MEFLDWTPLDAPSRLMYGELRNKIDVSVDIKNLADQNNFVIESFAYHAKNRSNARVVKIGSIQLSIAASTSASVSVQQDKMFQKVVKMIEAAAEKKVNILCLPELWNMPYPFNTPDDFPWREFSESGENGLSTSFLKMAAIKLSMIIISPILERDEENFFNTCLIISSAGQIIGKYRKSHIPPIEASFLKPGNFDHLVFDTEFGKIGILICFERHFPLNWMMLALKGAEIIFNPSSEERDSFSDRLWLVEARNAAASNGVFTVSVNRVGIESFPQQASFSYFGSTYVASPDGFATQSLPRDRDGVLITELDVNLCKDIKKDLSIYKNQHLNLYSKKLREFENL